MANPNKPSILLIDDQENLLNGLKSELVKLLPEDQVEVRCWQPQPRDSDPLKAFSDKIDANTILVATDYDLSKGLTGLFGLTIVGWCQKQAIPVGDFSRGNTSALPKDPELFELRIPSDDKGGAQYIASIFNGFQSIRTKIETNTQLIKSNFSPATILANLLERPHLDSQFALYMSRLGSANLELIQRIHRPDDPVKMQTELIKVLTYILGHVLINAILKFPGPILSSRALCAYCGTTEEETSELHAFFKEASYTGPFGESANYYWREDVDVLIDLHGERFTDRNFDDFGDYNRAVCEAIIGHPLAIHKCKRKGCNGKKGGFLCPFTHKTICQRADCSVSSSSWIPQGADLSRVEREFYDEWAPLLGL